MRVLVTYRDGTTRSIICRGTETLRYVVDIAHACYKDSPIKRLEIVDHDRNRRRIGGGR